ncbi:cytochrome c3 family protein [Vibrio hannami]|uniref:cytochrome c3 family protein n=1 Tax=Vibrio hannami TaxID=2717094 RepID=UPI00240F6585|nr:cytochrome c3 family protein [Vibrio hannami]MDG3085049.1 cytochrome c3 family protein [Vibrio hannami]
MARKSLLLILFIIVSSVVYADETSDNCGESCHIIKPYVDTAANQQHLLSYKHQHNGDLSCVDCHEQTEDDKNREADKFHSGEYEYPFYPRDFGNQFCLECHDDYEGLIEQTAPFEEKQLINPHRIHNSRIECASCHRVHRRSRFTCSECHKENWKAILPGWQLAE